MVPPLVFAAINATPRYRPAIPGLAANEREARGLGLPLGVCLVDLLFWDFAHRGAVFAGIAALAVGDPAAALIGSRWGQRHYTGWAKGRTLEGSIAFFLAAGLATALVAAVCAGGPPPVRAGVGCGAIGALVEVLACGSGQPHDPARRGSRLPGPRVTLHPTAWGSAPFSRWRAWCWSS